MVQPHKLSGAAGDAGNITSAVTGLGMAGTSGLYSTTGGFEGRAIAGSALQLASGIAGAVSGFAAAGSAAGPGGAIAGAALGLIAEGMQGGFEAYDAQKTRAKLLNCLERAEAQRIDDLAAVLVSCIAKSTIKLRAGVSKATLVGQPGAMIYRAGKAVYKTAKRTKGVGRKERATQLIAWAKEPKSPRQNIASDAVQAICHANFDAMIQDTVEKGMKSS